MGNSSVISIKIKFNDIINKCITQIPQLTNEEEDLKITIVEGNTSFMRGFVGFQEIFIHADSLQVANVVVRIF